MNSMIWNVALCSVAMGQPVQTSHNEQGRTPCNYWTHNEQGYGFDLYSHNEQGNSFNPRGLTEVPRLVRVETDVTVIRYSMEGDSTLYYADSVSDIGTAGDRIWIPSSLRNVQLQDRLRWECRTPWQSPVISGSDSQLEIFRWEYPSVWWTLEPVGYSGPGTLGGVFSTLTGYSINDDYRGSISNPDITILTDTVEFYGNSLDTNVRIVAGEQAVSYTMNPESPEWFTTVVDPFTTLGSVTDLSPVDSQLGCQIANEFEITMRLEIQPRGGNIERIYMWTIPYSGCDGPLFDTPSTMEVFVGSDMNADGITNGLDVGRFMECFIADRPEADFNHDGQCNGQDVGLFLNGYINQD